MSSCLKRGLREGLHWLTRYHWFRSRDKHTASRLWLASDGGPRDQSYLLSYYVWERPIHICSDGGNGIASDAVMIGHNARLTLTALFRGNQIFIRRWKYRKSVFRDDLKYHEPTNFAQKFTHEFLTVAWGCVNIFLPTENN